MPRSNFGPEVKASMQGNANTPAKGVPRPAGPKPPGAQVAQEGRDSSGNTGLPPVTRLPGPGRGGMPGMGSGLKPPGPIRPQTGGLPGGGGPDLPHIAAAAGIAHAILGNRGIR